MAKDVEADVVCSGDINADVKCSDVAADRIQFSASVRPSHRVERVIVDINDVEADVVCSGDINADVKCSDVAADGVSLGDISADAERPDVEADVVCSGDINADVMFRNIELHFDFESDTDVRAMARLSFRFTLRHDRCCSWDGVSSGDISADAERPDVEADVVCSGDINADVKCSG
ncbi:F-Box/Wd Repeat-Containing Protein 9 [Manis pentadactyla]|nr:F-Box/Wd Repeat-Containing Protein 9 [Manis pentadactyla]